MAKLNTKYLMERLATGGQMAAGAIVSGYIKTGINSMGGGKISPMMNAGLRLLAGAAIPVILGEKKKGGLLDNLGAGLMSKAAVDLAIEMKIPGISGDDDVINGYTPGAGSELSGYGDSPLSGTGTAL